MKPTIMFMLCIFIALFNVSALSAVKGFNKHIEDVSRLERIHVDKIIPIRVTEDAINAIRYATQNQLKISIAGSRHSQGGHIAHPNGVVLNMKPYNQILNLSVKHKTITVQSGITWDAIQKAINPHGLSIKVMQSSNIFTVGGSISANAHGRDPRYGPIIESIESLRVLLASGKVIETSRNKNSELFRAIVGGYGGLGVILEATITLTDNVVLTRTTVPINYKQYANYITQQQPDLSLHYGRCSFVKGTQFLRECYATNYYASTKIVPQRSLQKEKNVKINRFFFTGSRHSRVGKKRRWYLQKTITEKPYRKEEITRNQAMRPPIKFLNYHSEKDTDILQEYFVPPKHFVAFMDDMRTIMETHDVNLLSMTLRYLKKNQESVLSYSSENQIAIVLYINIDLDKSAIKHAQVWTKKLVDASIKHKGTYYLTYQRFPSLEQLKQAYPNHKRFKQIKKTYDPNNVFSNQFYQQYIN